MKMLSHQAMVRTFVFIILLALTFSNVNGVTTAHAAATSHLYAVSGSGVYRVDLDGTHSVRIGTMGDTLTTPQGIALDAVNGKLYVTNFNNNTISQANLDGSEGVSLGNPGGTLHKPIDIALDVANNKMYITNYSSDTITRANLDGTNGISLGNLGGTLSAPMGIALDLTNNQMYVTNVEGNTISRANLDGTNGVNLGNLGGKLIHPRYLALDVPNNKMYITNQGGSNILQANLDGTGSIDLGNMNGTITNPVGIALDVANNKMYIANYGTGIVQANLDGTGGVLLNNQNKWVKSLYDITLNLPQTPTTRRLLSIADDDGWLLESSENSNSASTLNSAAKTIRLGDDASKKQYRSILSFKTGALPDNAIITSVTLRVKKESATGSGDPLNILQGFMVDIKPGIIGAPSLETGDFQATTNGTYGPFKPALANSVYSIDLTSAKDKINKLVTGYGLTQIRLRFKLDDNNDAIANTMSLSSGNADSQANRPQLWITYIIP